MESIPPYTDGELVRMLRKGDHVAFTEIYNRYWKRLFYTGTKMLDEPYVAEELVQDVFCDLWKRKDTLDITGQLEHYLVVALRYRVINHQAREHRLQQFQQQAKHNLQQSDSGTEEQVKYDDLKAWLDTLVSKLPERCRLVFQLRQEGLSQREIARSLSITEKTVENQVGKALRVIKDGMGESFFLLFL